MAPIAIMTVALPPVTWYLVLVIRTTVRVIVVGKIMELMAMCLQYTCQRVHADDVQ